MSTPHGPSPAGQVAATPRRADAQRNREKLLAAAQEAFAAGDGEVTFDALARRAGVGVGTLYRNFPTRQALAEAVYESELAELAGTATRLLTEHTGAEALRIWVDRYGIFVATKHGMREAFNQAVSAGTITASGTRARTTATLQGFLDAGVRDGTLRDDVAAEDVTVALLGAILGITAVADDARRRRVLDLLVDSLRAR